MKASWTAVRMGVFLGAVSLAAFPLLANYHYGYYQLSEPFYASPVAAFSNLIQLRNDRYGKGFFGASRNGGRVHQGIDLISEVGQPIFAAKSGRVIFSGDARGYGLCVDILHPDGLWTRYAHLSALEVRAGDWVARKAVIGKCGKTGNAQNPHMTPHLHFEIRNRETSLNPAAHLLDPSILVK